MTIQQERVPIYLVIGRITAVLGMSFAAAAAIFFLIGALWMPALVAALFILPFAALMPLVETLAAKRHS